MKAPKSSEPTRRTLAVFNSRPIADYDYFAKILQSILLNKFNDDVDLILHGEDEQTLSHLCQFAKEEGTSNVAMKSRDHVLKHMTDVLLFGSLSDPTLYQELRPQFDRGAALYFIVQE